MRSLVTLGLILGLGAAAFASEPISLTYVVGSGYLVRQGDLVVAIDALTAYGVPTATRGVMQSAQPPFDVDLILVTHSDVDHFDAQLVSGNMTANPSAILVGPADVVRTVKAIAPQIDPARCIVVQPGLETLVEQQFIGLFLEVFSFPHPPSGVPENVGYRLTFDGLVLTHPGDIDETRAADDFTRTGWDHIPVDVAVLPLWFFDEAERSVLALTPAARYVPTHGSWSMLPWAYASAREAGVDVICLSRPLQQIWLTEAPGN